ncbi:cellulase family glycosylhydrolase [Algoriphagus sediminis]|uniref:Cellulase family glycosylhydrolase n=1 Tax=Algoriphagus sediminis TaxID=3057113 RepID=A0ABT7YC23_9BACT|nr:cellulase family glycosylhydrolase [Algoriphagus sediminis]MDN3204081.1 cellulase family glycosylhydrolase [Algoriphagus sediminis]
MKNYLLLFLLLTIFSCAKEEEEDTAEQWSKEKAWEWYDQQPWLVGTNFNPSTSINQLEFWQEETFDPETIDRELRWSAELGMNLHRIYLHNLLWDQDSAGFLKRVDEYLRIADSYGIKTMLVLLDDVWHPYPKLGPQPDPVPHLHNSGWVQAPGAEILGDSTRHDELENYIKGVMNHFGKDDRVLVWDIYNEPDNVSSQMGRKEIEVENKHIFSLALLKKVVRWSREINPDQPITTGLWRGDISNWGNPDSLPPLDRFMVENSDVISFHAYDGDPAAVKEKIAELEKYGRPLLCTEYLARGGGNTFEAILPIFKDNKIAAINWGFVSGKTNTIYPWESWRREFNAEPEVWHHDILRSDGTPFSEDEITFIKSILSDN